MSESSKDLYKMLNEKVKAATEAISEAERFADEHRLSFSLNFAYGMGGTYYPHITDEERAKLDDIGTWYPSETGWLSSSSQC
jgi:hypothetical protein